MTEAQLPQQQAPFIPSSPDEEAIPAKPGQVFRVPGFPRLFGAQVFGATLLLAVFLTWAAYAFPWVQWRATPWLRAGAMGAMLLGSGVLYFTALVLSGVKLRQFVKH